MFIWCGLNYLEQIFLSFFFFQAEDGIRDLVRSRGLGDVYKRQVFLQHIPAWFSSKAAVLDNKDFVSIEGIPFQVHDLFGDESILICQLPGHTAGPVSYTHLTLPTSDLV